MVPPLPTVLPYWSFAVTVSFTRLDSKVGWKSIISCYPVTLTTGKVNIAPFVPTPFLRVYKHKQVQQLLRLGQLFHKIGNFRWNRMCTDTIIFWAASYCKIANLVPRTLSSGFYLLQTNKPNQSVHNLVVCSILCSYHAMSITKT